MAIPPYDQFIEPILRYLARYPGGAPARDAYEAAAESLHLNDRDKSALLPSGSQAVYKNRAGWAHDRLKRAGLSSSPRRGFWQLTRNGIEFAAKHGHPLSPGQIVDIATEHDDVRLRTGEMAPQTAPQGAASLGSGESPDERLESVLAELHSAVAAEIRDALARVSPQYFESVVLDVLHRIGYGAHRSDLQRVGGSGDGGIDGIISLDRLGLEKVYVQAKRWEESVGAPDIQGFYGALAGKRATKGVFITTSAFTPKALEFARSVDKIVLVDGRQLADLMIENEVGVTSRIVKVPKLDSDYFDE